MNRKIGPAIAISGCLLVALAIACAANIVLHAIAAVVVVVSAGPQAATAVMGEAIIQIAALSVYAIPAFLLLTVGLTLSRYRASWFLWYVRLSSFFLLFVFPLGTLFAIFFFVYSFRHRHEFGQSLS